ncbi:hypothetical protein BC938DRAFT_479830 [Jimgerdemannia flammicorona]|uniref:Pre-SET domain-containing protein n=1 Tax=Jimgerdemannia flammicorona TaxID=994334 RepID=A0A433QK16_9FUNG|nr:hypothetical protein BC938DRAFT_479830 [Jimgerdemannia flammicorona]
MAANSQQQQSPPDDTVPFTPRELHQWFVLRACLNNVYPPEKSPNETLIPQLEKDFIDNFAARVKLMARVRNPAPSTNLGSSANIMSSDTRLYSWRRWCVRNTNCMWIYIFARVTILACLPLISTHARTTSIIQAAILYRPPAFMKIQWEKQVVIITITHFHAHYNLTRNPPSPSSNPLPPQKKTHTHRQTDIKLTLPYETRFTEPPAGMPEDLKLHLLGMRRTMLLLEREENIVDANEKYDLRMADMWEPGVMGRVQEPFPVVNEVDDEAFPHLEFLTKSKLHIEVAEPDEEFSYGCDCKDNCADPASCSCVNDQIDVNGRLPWRFKDGRLVEHSGTIYECSSRCSCAKLCPNRVVQNAAMVNPRRLEVRAEEKTFVRMLLADDFWIACAKHLHCIKHNIAYHPLSLFHSTHTQVFKTKHKGWGVRTRQAIRRGDFVGEYVGELLGRAEADARDSLKVAAGFMYFLNLPGEIKEGAFPGESDEVEDTETANV